VYGSERTTLVPVDIVALWLPNGASLRACFRHGRDQRTEAVAVNKKERVMSLGTILLIVLILILVGVLPTWPHARSWGYGPSGIVGVILVIVIVLFLMGRL
jgi:hypothetical protein